jgi:hypothetical protein
MPCGLYPLKKDGPVGKYRVNSPILFKKNMNQIPESRLKIFHKKYISMLSVLFYYYQALSGNRTYQYR